MSISDQSLSSLLGWISFACWIFVYSPQIYENYLIKSGEGVSTYLVVIWMIGDLANLFGTIKQHLLKTMIFLSIYYTACDLILLFQIFYYRRYPSTQNPIGTFARTVQAESDPEDGRVASHLTAEQSPLLAPSDRNSDHLPRDIQPHHPNRWSCKYISDKMNCAKKICSQGVTNYVGTYVLILTIGILGWLISEHTDHHNTVNLPPSGNYDERNETWDLSAQIFGWISAIAYLSSRLPQIFKNQITKCRGLSLLFFVIGITANVTYFASILIADQSLTHILINMSWLVGSGGTIFLDLIVLYQFWIYRNERDSFPILLTADNAE